MLKIFEWLEMWPTSMTREVDTNYKVQTAMGKRWGETASATFIVHL